MRNDALVLVVEVFALLINSFQIALVSLRFFKHFGEVAVTSEIRSQVEFVFSKVKLVIPFSLGQ